MREHLHIHDVTFVRHLSILKVSTNGEHIYYIYSTVTQKNEKILFKERLIKTVRMRSDQQSPI